MSPERWQKIKEILDEALVQPVSERERFINRVCRKDAGLYAEVKSFLDYNLIENGILEEYSLRIEDGESPFENPFIGRKIGNYEIVEELGAGGMGIVFLAERADGEFEQKVAVKFLRQSFFSKASLSGFLRERQILARLRHPFIAQLLDGGTTPDGTPYLVMEYVKGKPITVYAKENNLTIGDRLDLFRKVCDAVSFAHRNLIVHRDLKPDNILITEDGIPKLLDFGIAKLISDSDVKNTVTRGLAFTPEYASPEQLTGDLITTTSDVYCLGIVLYELLTGERPFRNENADSESIRRAIIESDPPRPSEVVGKRDKNPKSKIQNPKSLRGDLDNIILKALQREPKRRYASVEMLAEDLHRYQKSKPVSARADTPLYQTRKFIARNPLAVAAVFLAFISLIGGVFIANRQTRIAELERAKAERRFNDVQELADSIIFDIEGEIEKSPTKARKLLVERAAEYLDKLNRESSGNKDLQSKIAKAYEKIGNVQGRPHMPNLGDTAGALGNYRKALKIWQKLIAAYPNNADYKRALSNTLESVGRVQIVSRDYAKALKTFRQVREIRENLLAENPSATENRHLFAASFLHIGDAAGEIAAVNDKKEMFAEQIENYRTALDKYREINRDEPENRLIKRMIAILNQRLGSAFNKLGEQTSAPNNFQQSLAYHRRAIDWWAKANPADANGRFPAGEFKHIGTTLSNLGEMKKASENFEKARQIFERLAANDKDNVEYQREIAYLNLAVAQMSAKQKDFGQAERNYTKALKFFERNIVDNPLRVTEDYRLLTKGYESLGDIFENRKSRRESLEAYEKALRYLENWREIAPKNAALPKIADRLKNKIVRSQIR